MPRLLVSCLLLGLSLVLCGPASAQRQPPSKLKAEVPQDYSRLAPKELIKGKSLGWHTVYREPDSRGVLANMVHCFANDFGPGGDIQLVLCYRASPVPAVLINGAGKSQQLGLPLLSVSGPAWDFDGDGVCEIGVIPAAADGAQPSELQFIGLQGTKVGTLPLDTTQPEESLCIDFDGDGKRELLLQFGRDRESMLRHFAPGGGLLRSFKGGLSPVVNPVGDLDGDGRWERVLEDFGTDPACLISVLGDDSQTRYSDWLKNVIASNCVDINRDGRTEVFGGRGYYNPALNTFTRFEQVEMEWDRLQKTRATPIRESSEYEALYLDGRVLIGDFTHDGVPEALVTAGADGGAVLVFSLDGRCISYEELGEQYFGAYKLVQDGKDYAALIMKDRVLMAP
jgi:hypothetical protein